MNLTRAPRCRGRDEPGFSLLEVLIATAVLGIGCLSLLASFSTLRMLSESNSADLAVQGVVRQLVARIQAEATLDTGVSGFQNVYATYGGSAGYTEQLGEYTVTITPYLLEQTVPPQFANAPAGGLDLNADGDLTDDFRSAYDPALVIIPLEIVLTYAVRPDVTGRTVRNLLVTRSRDDQ